MYNISFDDVIIACFLEMLGKRRFIVERGALKETLVRLFWWDVLGEDMVGKLWAFEDDEWAYGARETSVWVVPFDEMFADTGFSGEHELALIAKPLLARVASLSMRLEFLLGVADDLASLAAVHVRHDGLEPRSEVCLLLHVGDGR
jgi:hypothetical protein